MGGTVTQRHVHPRLLPSARLGSNFAHAWNNVRLWEWWPLCKRLAITKRPQGTSDILGILVSGKLCSDCNIEQRHRGTIIARVHSRTIRSRLARRVSAVTVPPTLAERFDLGRREQKKSQNVVEAYQQGGIMRAL